VSWLGKEIIIESLRELSSEDLQTRRWLSDGSTDVSSFTEAVEQLFTDSGLQDALKKGKTGYSPDVDVHLRELDALLSEIDGRRDPSSIIADPAMAPIRKKSIKILELIVA
jgi:hypothetical protein